MSDLNTEILISANAEGVEAGVGRAKKSLSSLGDTAQKIGKNGADGMQALGAGADMSARKVESATKNMVGSLQRQIAAMEAGDKTSRKYQETLARMRGVDVAALKPYLDQLDSLQNKTTLAERAQASFNSVMLKGTVVFAAAGAIASYVKIINDGVDALNDLKDATGASIENISALEDVGKRAGASFDVVSTSLIKFNNVLSDAKPGSAAEQAIKALGLSIEDLKRLDPAEALRQTSVALNRFADDGDKARLVQELFGKSVKEVAPFLKDLAESGVLVAKVTTEQAEQAEKFNKELSALGKNAQDASRALVGPMVSALNDVIAKFKEGREAGKSFLEIANSRYWSNIRDFYGMTQPAAPSTGGATGSWGDGPDSKPSVGPLPDTKKPKGPTKAELSEYDKLIQKLGVDLPKAAADAEAAQMGYNKAQTEFLALAGSDVWAKFTDTQRATVAALFENKIASEQAADATKALAKANLDAAASREKYITSLATGLDKIQADIQAQIDATARMGLSKEAIADLDAAKLEMLATDTELQAIKALDRNLDEQTYAALKKQAAAYRELGIAKKGGAAKEAAIDLEKANAEAAKKAQEDWERASEQINNTLTDALMRGFESGKDFAKNLRDTVVNMFKTMVLRPVISVIVNPVAGAVTGMMGLSGSANASTGGASMLGNVGSLLGAGSSAFGIGASYGATSLFANGLGSTLSAGSSMVGAGSTMSGLGTIAGALAPISLGIGAIYAIAKSLDDSGTYHTGGAAQYSAATGLRTSLGFRDNEEGLPSYNPNDNIDNQFGTGFGYVERGDQTISAVSGIAQALGTALDGVAVAFGEKAGYAVATAFADDTSKDGAWGALRISKDGQELLNWENTRQSRWAPKEFADGESGYKEYLAAVAKDTRQVLLDMDLPSWADTIITSIGDAANMDQLSAAVQQIGQIQTAFSNLGKSIEGFAGMSDKTFEALMNASGGLEALSANAGSYYENFYSEAEKTAAVTRSVSDALAAVGLEMPATRDEFRALVESQLALGEGGTKAVAALLGVSGAFASVVPAAEAIGDVLSETMKRLQSDSTNLQVDLLRAQGDTAGADAAQRAIDTSGMSAAEVAIYDYNAALRAQITSLNDATAAAQAQAQREADAFVSLYGDLASAMDEINPPAKTLVDAFRSTQDELTNLTNGLAQALGNLPEPTTLEQLRASMEALRGIAQASSDLNEQIFGIKVGRGDQSAVELLKSREASLFADLQTSADPAGAANRLSQIVLQRISLEGKLEEQAINDRYQREFEAATTLADLESKNRSAQMDALREQISGAGKLSEIAKSMQGFIADLRFGDLSALNPADQLAAAQGEYQRILLAAKSGDVNAAAQLQSASTSFLREQQGYSGGATGDYASTFAQVVADLDAFGAMPVSDIALLQDQLASLDALEQASATLQTAVIDTSQRQIDALGAINVALLSRTDDTKARADEQKAILEKQVEALSTLVEDQKAQIAQAAATHKAMMDRLEAMANNIDRITANSNQAAAAPA